LVDTELIESAALPTTVARPDAKVILASTPWGRSGVFYEWCAAGGARTDPDIRFYRWSLSQAPWITPSVVEALRRRLSPARFAAEFDGIWAGDGDSFFPGADIDAAIAAYPLAGDGHGGPAVLGVDWGRDRDRHGLVLAGLLDDGGVNGRPVIVVPWCETSRRPYAAQQDVITGLAARWDLTVCTEVKGVGAAPSEQLAATLTRSRVVPVKTTQELKEQAYSRLQLLLSDRAIILPDHDELRKQLAGIVARPTLLGGLRIEARHESIHDDLADALAFAVWGLPARLASPPPRDFPDSTQWAQTAAGLRLPLPVATVRPDLTWAGMSGGYWRCPDCKAPVPSYRQACTTAGCGGLNPGEVTDPPWGRDTGAASAPALPAGAGDSVAEQNYWIPEFRRCLRCSTGYDGALADQCPRCHGSHAGARPGPVPGMTSLPAAFQTALSISPRR
jgi:hypothetical protein